MRIDKLEIQNFKKYKTLTVPLHPQFTLLAGENGVGKTSILDGLAVAMGVWLVDPPDTQLQGSRRNILEKEIRLEPLRRGDRVQFEQRRPVELRATGQIMGKDIVWARRIAEDGIRTSNSGAKDALALIHSCYELVQNAALVCPIMAYYGAGRAWLPSRERATPQTTSEGPARRWAAFYDCFNERVRFGDLREWFKRETIEMGNRGGLARPGFEAVRRAILRCVPGADSVFFSADLNQIVLSIHGESQPFDNLSAGQRMMLAMVADIAIRAVTQNAHLLSQDQPTVQGQALPQVLRETPGMVLIDELDVHLHPSWQRQVATMLKETFPALQFVCTSHSPQVIGELSREEVLLLTPEGPTHPTVARGADSNWLLDHVMEPATSEDARARQLREEAYRAMEQADLEGAQSKVDELRRLLEGGAIASLTAVQARLDGLKALRAMAAKRAAGT